MLDLGLQNTFSKKKKCMLFKFFIISLFNYYTTVWMCHSRGLKNKVNNVYERAFRKLYFETLFKRDKSTSIHTKNLQYLATSYSK